MKIIHFICRGNTFRSRLAEAYFNSLGMHGWKAISSGVGAERNLNGPIAKCSEHVLNKNEIRSFTGVNWTQTDINLLELSDIVVFMQNEYLNTCREKFGEPNNYLVLDIPDITDDVLQKSSEQEINGIAEDTFEEIKKEIDNIIKTKVPH